MSAARENDHVLETRMPNGGRLQMRPAVGLSRQAPHAESLSEYTDAELRNELERRATVVRLRHIGAVSVALVANALAFWLGA